MSSRGEESSSSPRGVAVITCAVLELEVAHYLAKAGHASGGHGSGGDASGGNGSGGSRVVTMEQGLHNDPPQLRAKLQEAVDEIEQDASVAAIVLGYGLCSRGIEGVRTRRCRLVVPRAHDCITILLGSKERYARYVAEHPGTYWYSPGWNKHHTPPGPERHAKLRAKYVEQFGEDNADYLMESEQHWFSTYDRATYVHLTVGATDADKGYTRDCADWLKWRYDEQAGDPQLLIDLLAGRWDDERFVVLEPGQTVAVTADERVIEAVKADA